MISESQCFYYSNRSARGLFIRILGCFAVENRHSSAESWGVLLLRKKFVVIHYQVRQILISCRWYIFPFSFFQLSASQFWNISFQVEMKISLEIFFILATENRRWTQSLNTSSYDEYGSFETMLIFSSVVILCTKTNIALRYTDWPNHPHNPLESNASNDTMNVTVLSYRVIIPRIPPYWFGCVSLDADWYAYRASTHAGIFCFDICQAGHSILRKSLSQCMRAIVLKISFVFEVGMRGRLTHLIRTGGDQKFSVIDFLY